MATRDDQREGVIDLDKPMSIRHEMALAGLHDLQPWWSPDSDSMVDPLDDHETKVEVRKFLGRLWDGCVQKENG